MAHVLVWDKLTEKEVREVQKIEDKERTIELLRRTLSQPPAWLSPEGDGAEPSAAERNNVLLDLFFYILQFCKTRFFTADQTSAFLSIMFHTHNLSMSSQRGAAEAFVLFQDYLAQHSVQRPPYSAQIFYPHDIGPIQEFALNTYFRHYRMYCYVFRPLCQISIRSQYASEAVQVPKPPLPLALALPEDVALAQMNAEGENDAASHTNTNTNTNNPDAATEESTELTPKRTRDTNASEGSQRLASQLEDLKSSLKGMTMERLDVLTAKIESLERTVAQNQPTGKGKS